MMEASKKIKKKGDSPLSAVAATRKREAKRRKKVHRDPDILRVQDALEHILVAGAKVRRDDWRRQEFAKREEQRATQGSMECPPRSLTTDTTAATIYSPRQKRRKRSYPRETAVYHAEDLRIYGKRHNSHLPQFASTTKQCENNHPRSDDTEWNYEHGDSVPPIIFRMARLSGEYPSEEQLSRFNDRKATLSKSFTSTNVSLEESDVPQALVEKCWERAIHIASNALIAPISAASTDSAAAETLRGASSNSREQPFSVVPLNDNTPTMSREVCRQKCESLGVDLESLRAQSSRVTSETTCPRCTRAFSTRDELLDHFYGTPQTIGCCQALIRPRHLQLIRKLLQTYTENQTDQFGVLLLEDSEQKGHQQQTHFDWRDVRRRMEHAVENSTPILSGTSSRDLHRNPRHPVQQSIEIVSKTTKCDNDNDNDATNSRAALPLMLNPMVLDAVNRRLIDRYTDVPP